MKKTTSDLGVFLESSRDRKGLTLRAVEKATGISNAYLSQLEGGKIRQPSPKVLHKLCEVYEISYADVMKLAGYPVPEIDGGDDDQGSIASRIGPVTPEEEESLIEYLAFLRSRRKLGGRS